MRDVVAFHFVSLDGVSQEPSDWFFDGSQDLFDHIGSVVATQDDVLLGRGTYDYWAPYWPASNVEPFASFINNTPKHVATSSPLAVPWGNSTPIDQPIAAFVRRLKQQPGRDIGVHASTTLTRSLIKARLVDSLRLVIAPAIAGTGTRLFDNDDTLQRFDLVHVEHTSGGTLLPHYRARAG